MISILCPSRGRPLLAHRMVTTALQFASKDVEILLYLNSDDPCLEEYKKLIDNKYITIGPDTSPGYSWNKLAEVATGEILFLIGDDVTFETQDWDGIVYQAFDQYPDKIVCVYPAVPDLSKKKNPHFCLHRNWINTLGYFVPPHFWHFYVDTWVRNIALTLKRYHRLENFTLPIIKKVNDETDSRANRLLLRDRDHWIWDKSQRHIEADCAALKKFIDDFNKDVE